jgi:hypothetical protein
MLEATIVEIWRQFARTKVTQSLNVIITTTREEIVVAPNMNVVKDGVLIRSTTNLGSGLGAVLAGRNLNQSSTLPIVTIGIIVTPQMVFTNLIMTTHVNKTTNPPLMTSMATKGYRSADATNPRGRYQEPSIVIAQIHDRKNCHFTRPNRVTLKYHNFKKDVDLDAC